MTIEQIEKRIRELRQMAFSGIDSEDEAVTAEIVRMKALAAPFWAKREKPESSYARVMWM